VHTTQDSHPMRYLSMKEETQRSEGARVVGAGVDITWSDGHASHYGFAYLGKIVPARCATMRGKKEEKRKNDERLRKENPHGAPPLSSSPALPMFKPKLSAKAAHAVGNYALQIDSMTDTRRDLQLRLFEDHLPL